MKKLISLFTLLLTLNSIAASKVMSSKVVELPVDIGTTKVKFTSLGYGQPFVKIIVPELAADTLMNHRNDGEDGPCLFTWGTFNVEDIVQGRPEVVMTKFKITLVKNTRLDQNGVCKVSIRETIEANVRGFEFFHDKSSALPDRVEEDCL